ncbi:MAG: LysM peptidoglycan-binding domain-containing protein [Porphyromonas sp.]|nr:LysM peptidoglycan-binding domain-containing protein [Porphyromonas sp.]
MKRLIYCLLLLASLAAVTVAQEPVQEEEVAIEDIGRLPESFEMSLDSLFHQRYKEYYNLAKPQKATAETRTLDQLYRKRLHAMESAIPLTYNPIVREAIDLYVNKRSRLLGRMLAKATYYFPIIESALDKHGLPLELKYLAIVESALNPTAVSRAGATGLWQFMLPTGKAYGLYIDSMIDERRDPYKSSEAMARYFQDMYALYGDWMLSIAAYNCGPGNVNKAIRRSGGKTDFWQIYQYLPRETRSYVPFYIAAFYAMEHYNDHDIRPNIISMPLSTDTVHINTRMNFQEISRWSEVSLEVIQELNPQYKKEIIPGNYGTQILRLPASNACNFSLVKDSLMLAKRQQMAAGADSLAVERVEEIIHKVRRGETLSRIAKKYGVTVNDLKRWNQLSSTRLSIGQRLKVSRPADGATSHQEGNQPTTRYYTVKRGDTLSGIARKYKGATVNGIRKANNIKGNNIKPGQRLIIP